METLEKLARQIRARRDLPSPPVCRALREAAGVSLDDVAGVVGVTRQAVSLWENGARRPRKENLDAYSRVVEFFRQTTANSPATAVAGNELASAGGARSGAAGRGPELLEGAGGVFADPSPGALELNEGDRRCTTNGLTNAR